MTAAEQIAEAIINLTIELEDQEELKEAWRVISAALRYLSSKDDLFTNEKDAIETVAKMKEKRMDKYA